MPHDIQPVLVADEAEILPKRHDESLDIRNNGVLNDRLVYVFWIGGIQFLGVDEIK